MILKAIVKLHRYLGVLLSLLLLIWSLSGIVMIYADFPSYSANERRAETDILDLARWEISPEEAVRKSHLERPLRSIELRVLLGDPHYRIVGVNGKIEVMNAVDGERVSDIDQERALKTAESRVEDVSGAEVATLSRRDRWTPQNSYEQHLPLYKVSMNDGEGKLLYVSSSTGEVVQRCNAQERFLAWFGPIPHWLYFRDLRVHRELWMDTVIVLAFAGALMCLLGIVLGFVRTRLRKGKWPSSIYRKGWFKWHHYLGFIFGLFLFTWTLSGALSLDPFSYHDPTSLSFEEGRTYAGAGLDPELFEPSPDEFASSVGEGVQEVRFHVFDGNAWYLLIGKDGPIKMVPASDTGGQGSLKEIRAGVRKGLQRLHPEASITDHSLLEEGDAYYDEGPFPVLRYKLDDAKESWYYASPRTGRIEAVFTRSGRADRWLYNGLHSLDFPGFYQARPLWDIVIIVLLGGVTLLSGTGMGLAVKWAIRKFKRYKSAYQRRGP